MARRREATCRPRPLRHTGQAGQLNVRQLAAEVARQQGQARDMKEKKPKQALELLQSIRATVASNPDLDPVSRDQLLRRLDISIADMQKHIAQVAPQLELDEKNKKVTEQVERERKQKVEVQEKVAYLVDDFNKLVEEQRYAEARVLAKRAVELDPDNPVVQQLNLMGKFLQRMAQQQDVKGAQEEGFYAGDVRRRQIGGAVCGPVRNAGREDVGKADQVARQGRQGRTNSAPIAEGN